MKQVQDRIAEEKMKSYQELHLESVALSYPECKVAETDEGFEICWSRDASLKLVFRQPKKGFLKPSFIKPNDTSKSKDQVPAIISISDLFAKTHRKVVTRMMNSAGLGCCRTMYYLPVRLVKVEMDTTYYLDLTDRIEGVTHLLFVGRLNLEAPIATESNHGKPRRKVGMGDKDKTTKKTSSTFLCPMVEVDGQFFDFYLKPVERLDDTAQYLSDVRFQVDVEVLKKNDDGSGFHNVVNALLTRYFHDIEQMLLKNDDEYRWFKQRQDASLGGYDAAMHFRSGFKSDRFYD